MVLGEIIFEKLYHIANSEILLPLSVKNYVQGVYLFKISHGRTVFSEKLILYK